MFLDENGVTLMKLDAHLLTLQDWARKLIKMDVSIEVK